jgi:hypothetical protein
MLISFGEEPNRELALCGSFNRRWLDVKASQAVITPVEPCRPVPTQHSLSLMAHVVIDVTASDWNGGPFRERFDRNSGPSASGPQIGGECDQLTSQGFQSNLLLNPWDHFYDEQLPVSAYIEEFSQEFLSAILPQYWA